MKQLLIKKMFTSISLTKKATEVYLLKLEFRSWFKNYLKIILSSLDSLLMAEKVVLDLNIIFS